MVGSNRTRRSGIGGSHVSDGMRGTLIGRGCDGPTSRDFAGCRIYHWSFRSGAMLAGRTVEGIVGGIPIKGLVVLRLGFTSKQPSEETRFGRTGLVLSIRLLIGAIMRGHAFGKSERGVSNTNLVGELIAVIRLLALGTYGLRWILADSLRASSGISVTWVPVIISRENNPTTTNTIIANTLDRPQASGEPRKKTQ